MVRLLTLRLCSSLSDLSFLSDLSLKFWTMMDAVLAMFPQNLIAGCKGSFKDCSGQEIQRGLSSSFGQRFKDEDALDLMGR